MLVYLARPMGSYPVPAASLLPPSVYSFLLDHEVIDPALVHCRDKGMDPWIKLVKKCDLVIALTSGGILTAGVKAEIEAAKDYSLIYGYTQALNVAASKIYNDRGVLIGTPIQGIFSVTVNEEIQGVPLYRRNQHLEYAKVTI